jgi:hypothetical protein
LFLSGLLKPRELLIIEVAVFLLVAQALINRRRIALPQ